MSIEEVKRLIVEQARVRAALLEKVAPFSGMASGGMPDMTKLMGVMQTIPEALELAKQYDEISMKLSGFVGSQIQQAQQLEG